MYLPDPGWLRPLVVLVLLIAGIILRFAMASRIGGFGLRRFRTRPDEDISDKIRCRLGEMCLIWAGWVVVQMAVRMPQSWMDTVIVPGVIVFAMASTYSAKLYAQRYLGSWEETNPLVTWLWIVLREAIPLAVILMTILFVRGLRSGLPEEIPVAWDLLHRAPIWRDRESALDLLRHRTMLVYVVLFGLEGAYLIVRWARARRSDIGRRMLSRPHWLFFMFRLGWVLVFAGFNLGCLAYSMGGRVLPYLAPGIFVLSALGFLLVTGRPARAAAPPPNSGPSSK